ncbi:MAG: hypothetical protein JW860_03180 [Sedimentisphaerales bacterium]|nr:hypothetical protein [Sedimentisphaerales bacterium]
MRKNFLAKAPSMMLKERNNILILIVASVMIFMAGLQIQNIRQDEIQKASMEEDSLLDISLEDLMNIEVISTRDIETGTELFHKRNRQLMAYFLM